MEIIREGSIALLFTFEAPDLDDVKYYFSITIFLRGMSLHSLKINND